MRIRNQTKRYAVTSDTVRSFKHKQTICILRGFGTRRAFKSFEIKNTVCCVVPVYAAEGNVGVSCYSSTHSQPRRKVGMNSEYHAPSVIPPGENPLHIVQETVRAPEPVWRFWRSKNLCSFCYSDSDWPSVKPRPAFPKIFWSRNTF